jgi:hypothetical protein
LKNTDLKQQQFVGKNQKKQTATIQAITIAIVWFAIRQGWQTRQFQPVYVACAQYIIRNKTEEVTTIRSLILLNKIP